MLPAVAALAVLALGRAVYPRLLERRQRRRRPLTNDGVIHGAEGIELPRPGAPAVLLLHGGGDTPQVLASLARYLHDQGYAVRVPLLSGHGRALEALTRASADTWHEEVETEYRQLRQGHPWVGVIGLSMGGALALTLAAENGDVDALVLLAPYLDMPPAVRQLADTSGYWGWLLPYFPSLGGKSIRDADAAARTLGHGILTPTMLRALRDVAIDANVALPRVQAPTLIVQSREDNRIAPEVAERGFARLGARDKKFVWTNGAGHVISVDFGHQRVFRLTTDWLEAHRRASRR